MTWRLFIDDERIPTADLGHVQVAKTVPEAIALVERFGLPELISFDHDLGADEHGNIHAPSPKFMQYLIDGDLDGLFDLNEVRTVIIHTRNIVGSQNLLSLWDKYSEFSGKSVKAIHRPRATNVD